MKYIYFVLGMLCVAVCGVGVVLPILPTAPFLLVAAFCFARSSERFYQWLIHTSMYQKHLEQLVTTGQMPLKSKITILAVVTPLLLIAFFMMHNLPGRITIIVLIVIKWYVFLFCIKTAPAEEVAQPAATIHASKMLEQNQQQ